MNGIFVAITVADGYLLHGCGIAPIEQRLDECLDAPPREQAPHPASGLLSNLFDSPSTARPGAVAPPARSPWAACTESCRQLALERVELQFRRGLGAATSSRIRRRRRSPPPPMASSVGKRERGRRRRVDGTVAVNRATYARDWNLEFVKFKSKFQIQIPNCPCSRVPSVLSFARSQTSAR